MFRRIRQRFRAEERSRPEAVPEQVTAIRSSIRQFGDPTDIVLRGVQAEVASEQQVAAESDRRRRAGAGRRREGDGRS